MLGFGQRLKEKRLEKNLKQQQLANMIGVSKVSICCYENETRFPDLANLIKLVESLEVDFNWLLGMEDKYNMSEDDVKIIKYLKNNKDLYNKLLEEIKNS